MLKQSVTYIEIHTHDQEKIQEDTVHSSNYFACGADIIIQYTNMNCSLTHSNHYPQVILTQQQKIITISRQGFNGQSLTI